MDSKIQTSQQRAGEHSDPAGKDSGSGYGEYLYGTDGDQRNRGDFLHTSQKKRGELSLPGGSGIVVDSASTEEPLINYNGRQTGSFTKTSIMQMGGVDPVEGNFSGLVNGPNLYTNDNQPSGVPVQRTGHDQIRTSQQIRGEYSLPGNSSVQVDSTTEAKP